MIFLVILLVWLWMILPGRSKAFPNQKYYAHRGLYNEDQSVMENSLEAFALAIEHGYGAEFDVQLSRDEEVVVFHDARLSRMFNRVDKVSDLTVEELKAINIPTLKKVLALFSGQQPIIIELKNHSNIELLCAKVAALLDDYDGEFMVESFDPRIVFWFRRHRSKFIRGQLLMSVAQYDEKMAGLLLISLLYNFLTRPHFLATHYRMKMRFYGWLMPLLGVKRVLWTEHWENVRPIEKMDAIIFEFSEPVS